MTADAEPSGTEAPQEVNADALEKRVTALEKALGEATTALTGRVNDVTKKVAENNAALTKRIGTTEADLGTVKTSADNNAEAIKAFDKRVDGLVHAAEGAKAAVAVLQTRLDNTEAWQSAFNTAFVNGIQETKDFALEQSRAAKTYTDQRIAGIGRALEEMSAALDRVQKAPVKPHTHAVHLAVTAETENPTSVTSKGN